MTIIKNKNEQLVHVGKANEYNFLYALALGKVSSVGYRVSRKNKKNIIKLFKSSSNVEATFTVTLELVYNGSNTITARWITTSVSGLTVTQAIVNGNNYSGTVDSTKNTLQNVDIYIDLDIGEAYSIDSSNNVVSLNNYVNIGGEIPTLPPGNTTITYSTSITNFKITPRWWIV